MRILLIEDDKDIALSLKVLLKKYYVVDVSFNGEEGESKALVNGYDLIIADYMLPDISGIEVCQRIRHAGIKTPILMLTANSEVETKVAALDSGADDYLTKPFNFDELLARIRALMRRQAVLCPNILKVDTLTLDLTSKTVKRKGEIIPLRRIEFNLLEYLMRNVGQVISREMIIDRIWNNENESMTNFVDVHIKYLRDKIDKPYDKKLIKTVHGFGYKLQA